MDKSKKAEGPVDRGLSAKIRKVEQRSADWLEKSTRHFSKKTWGILLALFIMLAGAISAMLLIGGLTGQLDNAFSLERITRTINAEPARNGSLSKAGLSEAELEKLKRYRLYLDSLAADTTRAKKYHQIIVRHSGLQDTLDMILNQSQIKNR